jgi:hypothetical protein
MDEIRQIANEVRDKCLRFAMSEDSIGQDYHGCEDLEMMCAVASTALARTLRDRKVDPHALVVEGKFDSDSHCWVLSRGLIVDITASQFNYPDVIIENEETAKNWKPENVGDPGKIASDWDDGQAPSDEVLQKILETA